MPRQPTRREYNQIFKVMADAGVIELTGFKMENGRMTPVYAAVPPEEWPPEGRALMGADGVLEATILHLARPRHPN